MFFVAKDGLLRPRFINNNLPLYYLSKCGIFHCISFKFDSVLFNLKFDSLVYSLCVVNATLFYYGLTGRPVVTFTVFDSYQLFSYFSCRVNRNKDFAVLNNINSIV